jgi:hypothetical protein
MLPGNAVLWNHHQWQNSAENAILHTSCATAAAKKVTCRSRNFTYTVFIAAGGEPHAHCAQRRGGWNHAKIMHCHIFSPYGLGPLTVKSPGLPI